MDGVKGKLYLALKGSRLCYYKTYEVPQFSLLMLVVKHTHVLWPFFQDYPGEPVPDALPAAQPTASKH